MHSTVALTFTIVLSELELSARPVLTCDVIKLTYFDTPLHIFQADSKTPKEYRDTKVCPSIDPSVMLADCDETATPAKMNLVSPKA
jgi:hypothetical protein